MDNETTAQPKATETAQDTAQAQEKATETIQEQPKVKVKFNHEEKEIPLEEAIVLAQKGMNYDKVKTKLDEFEQDESLKIADELASKFGVTRTDLLKKWKEDIYSKQAEETGLTVEEIREQEENKRLASEYKAKQQKEAEVNKQVDEFIKAHPEVKDDIPDEVIAEWNKGTPLKYAYEAYEAKQAKARLAEKEKELEALKTNKENAQASMGSAETLGAATPFKPTREWIANATPEEYNKHRHEILEAYQKGEIK